MANRKLNSEQLSILEEKKDAVVSAVKSDSLSEVYSATKLFANAFERTLRNMKTGKKVDGKEEHLMSSDWEISTDGTIAKKAEPPAKEKKATVKATKKKKGKAGRKPKAKRVKKEEEEEKEAPEEETEEEEEEEDEEAEAESEEAKPAESTS